MFNFKSALARWPLAILLAATLCTLGCGGVTNVGGPSIAGTYRLMSRDLPDGSVQRPPDVEGLITLTRDYRNLNVTWLDKDGNRFSRSGISRYKLGQGVYSETNIYYFTGEGDSVEFDGSPTSGTAPTVLDNRELEFQLPLHNEPLVVFTNAGFTATIHGQFVDHWERVK